MQSPHNAPLAALAARLRWVLWALVALAISSASVAYLLRLTQDRSLPPAVATGTAQIGGPFSLVDQTGKIVTQQSLVGYTSVIFFGWTHDPDQTPAALQVLTTVLGKRSKAASAIRPVFVTLDPDRDNPARLSTYLSAVLPPAGQTSVGQTSAGETIVGLTGNSDQIKDLASAYKLYWKRIDDASLPSGYSIDFAPLYYVMGAGGNFLGAVPYTTNAAELAQEIARLVP